MASVKTIGFATRMRRDCRSGQRIHRVFWGGCWRRASGHHGWEQSASTSGTCCRAA